MMAKQYLFILSKSQNLTPTKMTSKHALTKFRIVEHFSHVWFLLCSNIDVDFVTWKCTFYIAIYFVTCY